MGGKIEKCGDAGWEGRYWNVGRTLRGGRMGRKGWGWNRNFFLAASIGLSDSKGRTCQPLHPIIKRSGPHHRR